LLVIPGLYIAMRLSYVSSVVANEDLGPIASIKRSWSLTKGNLWDIIGAAAVAVSIVTLASIILYAIVHLLVGTGSSSVYLVELADLIVGILSIPLAAFLYFRYHQSDLSKAGVLKKEGTDSMNYLLL